MSEPTVAVLDVDAIEVAEGFNPRTRFDEGELATLAANLRTTDGLVQPLAVQTGESGGYVLIAGERRLRAAKQAGIEKVPVVVLDGDKAKVAALAENLIRVDLDPVEVAHGLQALADAEGLTTHKKIAARIDKSAGFVSEHLRLLKLPEGVQRHIAAGHVPVAAERTLRNVAKVSPRVAECACELVEKGEIEGRDLAERLGEVLCAVAEGKLPDSPTMIDAGHGESLSRIVTDPEKYAALAERYRAVRSYEAGADPVIRFSEAEVDAARAAGCLVEYTEDRRGWSPTIAYITDASLAVDLAERVIERIEQRAAEDAREQAELAGVDLSDDADSTPAKQIKEARRVERAERKKAGEDARDDNLAIGRALLARRGAKSRKEHSLARAKAVALVVLDNNPVLAARGLRLAFEQLQKVEVKTLKNGEPRTKVTYSDPAECQEYLANRIEEARSANEVLELLADAMIAAELTDECELPQSRRVNYGLRGYSAVEKVLADDIKAVRPRRRRKRS
ncbi:MAG TPA: ParB/RepB/Spo0J family partition protein [Solirubrobacterales bacterium]|nr:ParB/RepB/Spo0J family partition protein [Solirubrobacterales bacterium]